MIEMRWLRKSVPCYDQHREWVEAIKVLQYRCGAEMQVSEEAGDIIIWTGWENVPEVFEPLTHEE